MPIADTLPIHFFTIVLNGEPFIRYHLDCFKKLGFDWHWHIVEGLADLKHDTAWSLEFGATVPENVVREGRSVDGTAEYLDKITAENPGRVTIYRAPAGRNWDGKLEMVSAPLQNVAEKCLLWEIDSDELWTARQITQMRELFRRSPMHTAAQMVCWYFVGPDLVIRRPGGEPEMVWTRIWQYRRGMRWAAHEPPTLAYRVPNTGQWVDVAKINPITPEQTSSMQLIFQHLAYVTEAQLSFKETYYGYQGVTQQWRNLQNQTRLPCRLKDYFNWPWVEEMWTVDTAAGCGVVPLARLVGGRWIFEANG
jgi:hypothetical protein